jgi:myosin heavy subunit
MEAASHVWLSIENDPDMWIPAQSVHQQGGHVTLLATRDTRSGTSEQRIVVPEAQFRALPRADPTELQLLSHPHFAMNDASLLTMPSEPALLHLLRRRFNTGRRYTALGPWLIVLGDPSVYDEAPGEEEVHATARKNAGLYENEAEPSMAELAARVHTRMLTLRRPQAVVLLGGAAGGAADATAELLRFLRREQHARRNATGSTLAARAEAAVGVLHAFADAAAAFGDRTGGLCGWLRLRFDSAGRLRGGVLRGALLTGCRAGSCAKGVSAPRVFYLLLAGATALEREELTLPDSAAVAVCTKAGESLQREDVPSRAKAFGQLREHLRRARAHLEPRE